MTVQDTSLPDHLAENIVPGATCYRSTFPNTEGGEGIEGMLNGYDHQPILTNGLLLS